MQLEELLEDAERHAGTDVVVTAELGSAVEGTNAWILETGEGPVLLVVPADLVVELDEGDVVTIDGEFSRYDAERLREQPDVIGASAIADGFTGEYLIHAEDVRTDR
jgi:hypothetical protein